MRITWSFLLFSLGLALLSSCVEEGYKPSYIISHTPQDQEAPVPQEEEGAIR